MSGPAPVRPVTIIIDGITHQGSYFVQDSTVHVRSPLGTKATQVGRLSPEAVAKLLLSELVRATKIALIMRDNESSAAQKKPG